MKGTVINNCRYETREDHRVEKVRNDRILLVSFIVYYCKLYWKKIKGRSAQGNFKILSA